jgi:hypothetical protein
LTDQTAWAAKNAKGAKRAKNFAPFAFFAAHQLHIQTARNVSDIGSGGDFAKALARESKKNEVGDWRGVSAFAGLQYRDDSALVNRERCVYASAGCARS